jgi:hypothetical protein
MLALQHCALYGRTNIHCSVPTATTNTKPSYAQHCYLQGLIPATFIHVSTGKALRNAAVVPQAGQQSVAILFCLQFVALLPVLLKKKLAAVTEAKVQQARTSTSTQQQHTGNSSSPTSSSAQKQKPHSA